mgnify:CR=1 FL=1
MLENNIDISKAPLIRLIFFIFRLFSSYNSNYLLLLFLCNMTIATISIMIIIGICLTRKLYVPLYRYLSYLDTLFSSSCMYDNKCSFLCETVSRPNNSDNLTATLKSELIKIFHPIFSPQRINTTPITLFPNNKNLCRTILLSVQTKLSKISSFCSESVFSPVPYTFEDYTLKYTPNHNQADLYVQSFPLP